MNWHEESVPKECLGTAQKLGALAPLKDFYLAGGTALALHLGHRMSVDLDFFSNQNALGGRERARLERALARTVSMRIDEEKDETVHVTAGKTHVSFFYFTPALLRPAVLWNKIRIASVEDIGCMKLSAVVGRGSKKDFYDLYVIATEVIPLSRLLSLAQEKFPHAADFTAQALRALVYFDDADTEGPLQTRKAFNWSRVKKFFEAQVRTFSRSFF